MGIDTSDLKSSVAEVSIVTVALLTILDLLLRILSAYRWHILFSSTNTSSSLMQIARISFVSSFLGQALPGAIGIEALRIYGLAKATDDSAGAFASVIADRVFGLTSLVLVVLVGLAIGPIALGTLILKPVVAVLIIMIIGVLAILIPKVRQRLERIAPEKFISRIREWVDKVYACFDYYGRQPGLIIYSFALAILFQVLRVTLFFAAALLIGQSPDFIYFVAIVPIVMFASLLPISISGLGVREAGLVLLFTQFGVMESAPAFTVAILVFLTGLLSTLPGAWFYARRRTQYAEVIENTP
jgi:uncharacterized protein (TIRG00374 family)